MKIGISGISGRIGQRLIPIIQADEGLSISCGLVSEHSTYHHKDVEVSNECKPSDIWIDFSTPVAFEKVLFHCIKTKTPLVSGTTGLSRKHFKDLENAAQHIPVLWASNYAISVNLIQNFLSRYSQLRALDVNITETHHINKADKPSGTAISLARSIKPHGILKTVKDDEFILDDIKIKSIRDKNSAGIHKVELENKSEIISISHQAKTPVIFAQGAANVSKWLISQDKGFYTMADYIDSL